MAKTTAKAATQVKTKAAKETKSLFFILCNCSDPAKEADFNEWYMREHIPDVMSSKVYHSGVRWVNVEIKPGAAKYLTVYESDWDDANKARDTMSANNERLRQMGRSKRHEALQTLHALKFSRLGQPMRGPAWKPGMETKSVLAVMVNCSDPAKEAEFNEWYNKEHAPDTLSSKVYHTATRYVNADLKAGEPKYLCIYETAWEDANAARDAMGKANEELRKVGRATRHPNLQSFFLGKFQKMSVTRLEG